MQDKNLIDVNLTSEMKTSFIDYAMSGVTPSSFIPYKIRR